MEKDKLPKKNPSAGSGQNKNVFYVGMLSFFGGISQDVFSPILPIYLTTVLGFNKSIVGIAEGIISASVYFFRIIAGVLSDKFKKQKPIIFLGYFLSMVARPLLILFTSLAGVVSLRLLDGLGKGLKDTPKDVLIADSSDKSVRGESFGLARMLDTLGSVVGPLVLFALLYVFKDSALLYHQLLLFCAIPLIITLLLVFKLREIPKEDYRKVEVKEAKGKLPVNFYIFIVIVIIFTLGNSSDAFLILRAQNVGMSLLVIPLVIAMFNLVYAGLSIPLGSLSDRIGRVPMIAIGWGVFSLVYLGFGLASNVISIWFLYAFYGMYYAMNEGVSRALLADLVNVDHRGKAFGIYGMAVGLTTLPASFFAGFLWDKFGAQVPFFFGAGMSLIALLALLIFSRKLRTE